MRSSLLTRNSRQKSVDQATKQGKREDRERKGARQQYLGEILSLSLISQQASDRMTVSVSQDADPLRSSLDRHLVACDASVSSKKLSESKNESHIGQIREAHGLCPSCGQQLYKIEEAKAGFLCCCLGEDEGNVRKVPLTIPRLVDRGQCLACKESLIVSRTSTADTISTNSSSSFMRFTEDEDCSYVFAHTSEAMEREAPYVVAPTTALKPPPPGSPGPKPPPPGTPGLKPPPPGSNPAPSSSLYVSDTAPSNASSKWLPAGTAVYRGPYNDKGQRHGEGEMVWSNGDVYRGSFVRDNREGHGTLTFAPPENSPHSDGGEYVGDWKNDMMDGGGTRRYPNGDVYMGQYREGVRNGEGRFYYANGDLYWGQWQNNQMHGPGRYYYSSGQRFEGTFDYSKRTGKGKLQRTDGTLEIFQYVNDQRVGQGVRWSADRTRAWRLWMPSSEVCKVSQGNAPTALQKQKMTVSEAVSLVYDIEQASCDGLDDFNFETT